MRSMVFVLTVTCVLLSPAMAQQAVGWRTDGTGRYLDADPPTEWAKDKNVVWATPMPDRSNATPILVGDKIFVCSQPTTLVCVNAADGKILWQKTNTYMDVLSPAEAAKAKEDLSRADGLYKKLNPIKKEFGRVRSALRKKPKDEALLTQAKDLRAKMRDLQKQIKPLDTYRPPPTHPVNGHSTCTPVSDGKKVWVLFGTGVAACYDLDGTRLWAKVVQKPTAGYGQSASPLLLGEKFIVHILSLVALDKATGKVLWEAKAPSKFGSIVHARAGDVDVVCCAGGDVIRVADGAALARRLGNLAYCAPVVDGRTVYYVQTGGRGVRLGEIADAKIKTERLWQTQPRKDRYYASPVCHDGLIYAVTQKGILSAIDAKDGKVVYEQDLKLGKGTVYPSIALAGEYLFVSSDNGTTVVAKLGRTFEEVARNSLETFRACPVFAGKRLYIRAYKKLYCIGT